MRVRTATRDSEVAMREAGRRTSPRAGLTLLEVLCAVGIVGLLAALALPAIQQARATARHTVCQSRLKELGSAFHAFEESRRVLPVYSHAFIDLLPYIDQADLHAAILRDREPGPHPPFSYSVPLFTCPADPDIRPGGGQMNYKVTCGTRYCDDSPHVNGLALSFRPSRRFRGRTISDVVDGTSTTAALSERRVEFFYRDETLPSDAEADADPVRFLWFTTTVVNGIGQEEQFVDECVSRRTTPKPVLHTTSGRYCEGPLYYDHLLPPNSVGCHNGPPSGIDMHIRLIPPNSLHAGGVNLLYLDGHVAFVSDAIDLRPWRAIATIAGGDNPAE